MKGIIDTSKAEKEILEVLNKNKIPLALIPRVNRNVMRMIKTYTVPYTPNCFLIKDNPISEITESATDSKEFLVSKDTDEDVKRAVLHTVLEKLQMKDLYREVALYENCQKEDPHVYHVPVPKK